jgi:hypothetical protein
MANVFDDQALQAITNIQPVHSDQHDILRWTPSKNEVFAGTSTSSSLSNYPNKDQEASSHRKTTFCSTHGRANTYHHLLKLSPGDSSEGP